MTQERDQRGSDRGFAAMDDQQQREIARRGGESSAEQQERDEQGQFAGKSADQGGGEAKTGAEFIKHEYDEAIAVQQCIVDAETELSASHPVGSAQSAIEAALADDQSFLEQLRMLGEKQGATGEIEDVAGGLNELMDTVLGKASEDGADSDYYEAHAVLLNLKRKQMDSAGGMLQIARATGDRELEQAAGSFQQAQKASAEVLATELAMFAVRIASAD